MSNLKWRCNHCGEGFRIKKPGKRLTKEVCSHRISGRTCGQAFYHGSRRIDGKDIATMSVWPAPESIDESCGCDVMNAARLLRDYWDSVPTGKSVHATVLYNAMLGVVEAVNATEGKT